MLKKVLIISVFILISNLNAQKFRINKIEPPFWWVGMKSNTLELMIYGNELNNSELTCNSDAIKIVSTDISKNGNYAFVRLQFDSLLKAGTYDFNITKSNEHLDFNYEMRERIIDSGRYNGFDQSDVIYLITPDRFVDGNPDNNRLPNFDDEYDRDKPYARHGGDIEGIISKLDYLSDLGITAIWINPLTENNTNISYHGYATTDMYNIDARFGSNELYKEFVESAHSQNLKVIMDHVSNHISIDHPWISNLPEENWLNGSVENHLNARHEKMAYFDLHASDITVDYLSKGWFTNNMPDLNQRNSHLSTYLIQNTIWWIEFTGIDGIREDTYPYADQMFLSEWAKAVLDEYPGFNIVGEVWTGNTTFLAGYQQESKIGNTFNTYLPTITDFALRDAIYHYLKGSSDLYQTYLTISKDYIYQNPGKLVTFVDNHDIERVMYAAGENINKAKIALALILTTRGIPQILYGTEIGMVGTPEHGYLRMDFPGGFPGDIRDAFFKEGRNERENDIFNFVRHLLTIRKNYKCLSTGKLTHYPPYDNLYVYKRVLNGEEVIVIINGDERSKVINHTNYEPDLMAGKFLNLINDQFVADLINNEVNPYEIKILLKQ